MMEPSPAPSWRRQIAARVAVLWPLKALGTMGFMLLFFWAYFAVLRNPLTPPVVMPVTWLDRWIGFSPAALPAYLSLWVYVSLAPALLGSLRALLLFGLWIAWLCVFCLAIFWIFPTSTPPAAIDWAAYPQFAFIKGLDAASNAFPSLHVATAVFSAFWLDRLFARLAAPRLLQWLNVLQCSVIIWSTIATRQHVVLDAVGGLAVGIVFAVLSLRRARGDY
ncbi:phosphatase PAP2 family protein [Thiobacillus sedimenti]|uniref:Phosphatase PAP2 family protein n=1 Tax=Thiobacillus sedimenti TaxID=3110231 RepID=A0ABZ1CIW6_9PROT|nr:phosphatase PAP2 family protein [Thiobacillus sp. SCUT-2]WRS39139.1 phosphatase PAP2 family protein [Thiobacillus sp. SCUT-2]